VLTGGARLPDTKEEFLAWLRTYLGDRVFDGRYVAHGGAAARGQCELEGPSHAHGVAARCTRGDGGDEGAVAGRGAEPCRVQGVHALFFAWDDTIDMHAGCIHGLHSQTSSS